MELRCLSGRIRLLVGLVVPLAVLGCQGTEWGEQFGRRVQVERPPTTEATPTAAFTPFPDSAPTLPGLATPSPEITPTLPPVATGRFGDLAGSGLTEQAVADLDRLGVLANIDGDRFEPRRSIRRGEFARWLVLANNAIHSQDPSRQLRLGSTSERPSFLDVPEDDPHFVYVQALAAAGIISGNTNREFRPTSLLSRADLVHMKVPLDLPPGQIAGTLEELRKAWGFNDAARIPAYAVPAIVADRSLGGNSNISRAFGPIRVFNPQDPVSRAEAALALSAFGERTAAQAPTPPQALSPAASPTPLAITPSPTPGPALTPEILTPSPSPTPPFGSSSDSEPGQFITPTRPSNP